MLITPATALNPNSALFDPLIFFDLADLESRTGISDQSV